MQAIPSYAGSGGWADRWGRGADVQNHSKSKASYLRTFTDGEELADRWTLTHKVWAWESSADADTLLLASFPRIYCSLSFQSSY